MVEISYGDDSVEFTDYSSSDPVTDAKVDAIFNLVADDCAKACKQHIRRQILKAEDKGIKGCLMGGINALM